MGKKLFFLTGLMVFGFSFLVFSQPDDLTRNFQDSKKNSGGRCKVNVFAVFSEEINRNVLFVSQELKKQEGLESFPLLGFQIHCTLYMTQYDEENFDKVQKTVASLAGEIRSFEARTSGLHCTKDNWLFINLEKNRRLQDLSDVFVNALSPLRSSQQKIPSWLENYPEKKEFFLKFGSPNVFSQFEPHFTLLAKADEFAVKRFIERNKANPEISSPKIGKVVGIGIARADEQGQFKDNFTIFPLK